MESGRRATLGIALDKFQLRAEAAFFRARANLMARAPSRGRRVICVLVGFAAFGVNPAAGADPPLAFADEHELKLSWARLSEGVSLDVCNMSEARVTATVTLAGFGFQVGSKTASDGTVVIAEPPSLALGSGKCTLISLRAGQSPDAGKYAGTLALHTPTAFVRRDVTITGPKGNTTRPKSPVEEVDLRASRNSFFDESIGLVDQTTCRLIPFQRPASRYLERAASSGCSREAMTEPT